MIIGNSPLTRSTSRLPVSLMSATPVEERTAYTFTAAEAKQLVADVAGVMGAERPRRPGLDT